MTLTCCCFLFSAICTATHEVSGNVSLAIFVPMQCPRGLRFVYNDTVTLAMAAANDLATQDGVSFVMRVYDSCSEQDSFRNLFRLLNHTFGHPTAVIGPGNHALCEPASRLLALQNEMLVSWGCISSELKYQATYRTLVRLATSADEAVLAMRTALVYFRLHFVAIVFSAVLPESTIAGELQMRLSNDVFSVTAYYRLLADHFVDALEDKMRHLDPRTKGQLLRLITTTRFFPVSRFEFTWIDLAVTSLLANQPVASESGCHWCQPSRNRVRKRQ